MDHLRRRISTRWPSTLPSKRLKLAKHVYTHGMHPWEHMSNQQLMRRRFVYHSIEKNRQDGIQQILALTRLSETFLAGRVEQVKEPPSDLIISHRRHLMEYGLPQLLGIDLDANNLPIGYITDDCGMPLYDLSPKIHCDILGILQETSKMIFHMHASGVLHNDISPGALAVLMSRFEHGAVVEHFLPKGSEPFVLQQTLVYKLIGFDKCKLQTLPAPPLAMSLADLGRFACPQSLSGQQRPLMGRFAFPLVEQPPLIHDVHHARITPPTYMDPSHSHLNDDILRLGQTLIAVAVNGHETQRPEAGNSWQSTIQFVETLLHFTATPNRLFEFLLFTKHCISTMLRCQASPPGVVDDRVLGIFKYMFPVHETPAPDGVKLPIFVIRTKMLLSKFHDYAFANERTDMQPETHPIESMMRLNVQDELDAWWSTLNTFVLHSEHLVDINNHTHQLFSIGKKTEPIPLPMMDEPTVFIDLEAISLADMSIDVNKAQFSIYPMEPILQIAGTTIATAHCLREMTLHKRNDRIGALPLLLKTRRFTADCRVAIEEVVEPFGVFNLHTAGDIFYTPCATRSFLITPQLINRNTPSQKFLTSLLAMDTAVLRLLGIDPNGFVPSWLYRAITIFEETTRIETMPSDVLTDTLALLFVSAVLMAHRLFSNDSFVPTQYACCGLLIADTFYSDANLWQSKTPVPRPGGDSNVWKSLASTFADQPGIVIPESEQSHINGMRLVLETMEAMILTTCQWKLPQSRYAILYDLVAPSLFHDQRMMLSRLICRWMGDTLRLSTELDPRLVFIAMLDAVGCSNNGSTTPTEPPADPIQSESVVANAMLLRSSKTLHFHMITSIYEMPEATFTTLLIPIYRVIQALQEHLDDLCLK